MHEVFHLTLPDVAPALPKVVMDWLVVKGSVQMRDSEGLVQFQFTFSNTL